MNNAKTKTANLTRADICTKKYSNDKKIIVSLVLTATLLLYLKRADYHAMLWKTHGTKKRIFHKGFLQ